MKDDHTNKPHTPSHVPSQAAPTARVVSDATTVDLDASPGDVAPGDVGARRPDVDVDAGFEGGFGGGFGAGLGTGLSPVGAPIPIEINRTLAELLARLCVELGTEDHVGVLSRALGLLEMVQRTKRQGGRLCFINERGETADVIA